MVSIPELRLLGDKLIENDPSIKNFKMAVSEEHAYIKLSDLPDIILLILYPSADREGKQNEAINASTTWLWVLEKDNAGQTDTEEEAQFEKLRLITVKALEWIEEKSVECGIKFLNRYQPNRTQIIPEYSEFGGFNGWSMSLTF